MTMRIMRSLLFSVWFVASATTNNAFVLVPQKSVVSVTTLPSTNNLAAHHHLSLNYNKNLLLASSSGSSCTSTALTATTGKSSVGDDALYIDPDFRLAGIFLALGYVLEYVPILKWTLGPLILLLGLLFLVQTFRLKFVCDSTSFELLNTAKESGENLLVGGANRWTYKSFVNYDFFPSGWIDQPQGPILVYFKENQTPSETWSQGPGQFANSDEALAKGAKPGQVHFFPAICNCQQLQAEWERRGCQKL